MYSFQDLVPFTANTWQAHYASANFVQPGLAIVLLLLFLILLLRTRCLFCNTLLLAACWVSTAFLFHFSGFNQIHFAGEIAGYACLLQALVLALVGYGSHHQQRNIVKVKRGFLIFPIAGFFIAPVIGMISNTPLSSLDLPGSGPDSIAFITIAWLFYWRTGYVFWQRALLFIPVIWLLFSLTLYLGML